jgi:hypothetical protein
LTPSPGPGTIPAAQSPRAQNQGSRRRDIVALLEQYDDLLGITGSNQGYGGEGITILSHARNCGVYTQLRCNCWQRSLTELDRALCELRLEKPVHHAHLVARHRDYTTVRRTVWYRHGRYQHATNEHVTYPQLERGKTPPTQAYDCVLHVWRPWVDPLIVIAALDRLEQLYRGEVRLPSDNAKRTAAVELSAA